nr:isochorismatase family protein [Steroidobacter agaridevorans]
MNTPLPTLLIIDMQKGMASPAAGPRNNPNAEGNIATLLKAWRGVGATVVHVRHISRTPGSPFWPGQPGVEFQEALAPLPGEHVVEKNVPDALVNTGLEKWLRVRGVSRLVIVGVSTNNSVEATARTAGNLGFQTQVVADATFAFDKVDYHGTTRTAEEVHAMALANLNGEYATITTTVRLLPQNKTERVATVAKATVTNDSQHVENLRSRFNAGEPMEFLFFWGHKTSKKQVTAACFSQWYEAAFVVDTERYLTAEHFMMAEKAALFGDQETRAQILQAANPGAAKALGRKVRGFDDAVWAEHRFGIVVRANQAKFSQNPALRQFLESTGSRILVEASPVDRIWGIGMAKDHDRANDPNSWRGLNLLGFALMQVRHDV